MKRRTPYRSTEDSPLGRPSVARRSRHVRSGRRQHDATGLPLNDGLPSMSASLAPRLARTDLAGPGAV